MSKCHNVLQIIQSDFVIYSQALTIMQNYTKNRDANSLDTLWLLQHPAVFTQGVSGTPQHILQNPTNIPIIYTTRGGQITYHGPGQCIAYALIDLRRKNINVKQLVYKLEQTVIDLLAKYSIEGERQQGKPGIFVNNAKIAQLGLRIQRGCSYHGLSLNTSMDLGPFAYINPCGFKNLAVTQISNMANIDFTQIKLDLIQCFTTTFAYSQTLYSETMTGEHLC